MERITSYGKKVECEKLDLGDTYWADEMPSYPYESIHNLYSFVQDENDLNDLKKLTLDLLETEEQPQFKERNQSLINKIYGDKDASEIPERLETLPVTHPSITDVEITKPQTEDKYQFVETVEEEEPLSLQEKEIEMIRRALERSKGRRKKAAQELGISERTLYRKIKQFDLNEEDE